MCFLQYLKTDSYLGVSIICSFITLTGLELVQQPSEKQRLSDGVARGVSLILVLVLRVFGIQSVWVKYACCLLLPLWISSQEEGRSRRRPRSQQYPFSMWHKVHGSQQTILMRTVLQLLYPVSVTRLLQIIPVPSLQQHLQRMFPHMWSNPEGSLQEAS